MNRRDEIVRDAKARNAAKASVAAEKLQGLSVSEICELSEIFIGRFPREFRGKMRKKNRVELARAELILRERNPWEKGKGRRE